MKKEPFVTKAQLDEIIKTYPTPFHLYDEKGMRENMKALKEAFSWNKGYREYFAVKATPNPFLINILREYGCGCDCSSFFINLCSPLVSIIILSHSQVLSCIIPQSFFVRNKDTYSCFLLRIHLSVHIWSQQ